MIQVGFRDRLPATDPTLSPTYYDDQLEITPTHDEVLLPRGIGVAGLITNATASTQHYFDRCGCILFDGHGRVMVRSYQFGRRVPPVPVPVSNLQARTAAVSNATLTNSESGTGFTASSTNALPVSQVAFYLYDSANYQAFLDNSAPSTAAQFNQWMTDNAVPFIVNRYNGSLTRVQ